MKYTKEQQSENTPTVEAGTEYKAVIVNTLYVTVDRNGVVYAEQHPVSKPASRLSPFIENFVYERRVNGLKYSRWTDALLDVAIDSGAVEEVAPYLQGRIYLYHGHYYAEWENTAGMSLYDLIEGHPCRLDVVCDGDMSRDGVIIYGDNMKGCMLSSSDQIKNNAITFPADNLGGLDFYHILDKLTFGMLTEMQKAQREASNPKELAQASTRLAQVLAPAVEGLYCDVFAVYMGIYNPLWDGEIYIQSDYEAMWLANRLGIANWYVEPAACIGLTNRCRPFMCKGNGSVVSRFYLDVFFALRGWKTVVIERSAITPEIQADFNEAVWSKGRKGHFAGKLVVVCDSKAQLEEKGIQVFTDLNGLKQTFNLRCKSGLNVLDITEKGNDTVRFSTQMLATLLVADQNRANAIFDRQVEAMIEDKRSAIMADEGRAPKGADFHDGMDLGQMIEKIVPQFFRDHWNPGFRKVVDQACKGFSTKLQRCIVPLEGCYNVLVVDPAIDFGINVLKFENGVAEVLCKSMQSTEGMMLRYPKVNAYGITVAHAISADEYLERAKGCGLSDTEFAALAERVKAILEGVCVVPASQDLMDKHGDWDYDGDRVQIVTEPEVVSIAKKALTVIVHITEDEEYKARFATKASEGAAETRVKTVGISSVSSMAQGNPKGRAIIENKDQKMPLDATVCRQHWMRTSLSPNRSPGQTVVAFSIFSTVLLLAKAWKNGDKRAASMAQNIWHHVFGFGATFGVEYEPLPLEVREGNVHQYVAECVIKEKIDLMRKMALTAENVFAAAFDLQAIARYYVETIIRAVKTGKMVIIENLEGFDTIDALSRMNREFHINWDTHTAKVDMAVRHVDGHLNVPDVFQTLKVRSQDKAKDVMVELCKTKQEFPAEYWQKIVKSVTGTGMRKYVPFARLLKQMYWTLNGINRQYKLRMRTSSLARGGGNTPESLLAATQKTVKEAYNEAYDNIRNFARCVLADVSPIDRIYLMLYVTFTDRDQNRGQLSQVAQDLLKEEFFHFVLDLYKDDDRVPKYTEDRLEYVKGFIDDEADNTETYYDFSFGGEYESEDGSKYARAEDPDLFGEFLIRKNKEGHWVAYKPIADLVPVPEPKEKVICFITKMSSDKRIYDADVQGKLALGKTVTLVPAAKIGKGYEDAIIVDDESIGEFRCDPIDQKTGKHKADTVIRRTYTCMQGEVSSIVAEAVKGKREPQYVAIVTLKDVRKVARPVIKSTTRLQKQQQTQPENGAAEKTAEIQAIAAPFMKGGNTTMTQKAVEQKKPASDVNADEKKPEYDFSIFDKQIEAAMDAAFNKAEAPVYEEPVKQKLPKFTVKGDPFAPFETIMNKNKEKQKNIITIIVKAVVLAHASRAGMDFSQDVLAEVVKASAIMKKDAAALYEDVVAMSRLGYTAPAKLKKIASEYVATGKVPAQRKPTGC